jgi:hypothetical protein
MNTRANAKNETSDSGKLSKSSRSNASLDARSANAIASPFAESLVGNQALESLLQLKIVQPKLRVSQPADPDEQEADRAAAAVVSRTRAPKIQRKCACSGSGSPCAKCQEEDRTIHRGVASSLSASELSIQRATATDNSAHTPDATGNSPKPSPTPNHAHPLVVDDDAKSVGPHQMRKSAFIALLRLDACATADVVLMSVGRSTKACPYIQKWLAFYEKQSADHIARAVMKYAPETARARSAHDAIRLVVMRVQHATMTWAKTGKLSGLPEELVEQIQGGSFLGAMHDFASSSVGGALLGFLGGSAPEKSKSDSMSEKTVTVARKADSSTGAPGAARDAASVRSQLGGGHSLDSRVQSQMSSAFGHDFSGVRVHTDSRATAVSSSLRARAFTIGTDVAFASGEYKPGTPAGDALIAHELAHVVQQSGATNLSPMTKETDPAGSTTEPASSHLENDADLSAVGTVAKIWAGAKHGLADLRQNAVPRLRSGLRLQRCSKQTQVKDPTAQQGGAAGANCPTADNTQWKTQVHDAITTSSATVQFHLVEQALCPLGIQVRLAGTSNPNAEDPADYAEWQGGRVINYDPKLNTKTRRGSSTQGATLENNAGHNFTHGKNGWAVLGPKSLGENSPLTTRQFAQHELFILSRNLTAGKNESRADTEVAAWTHDFTSFFHQYLQQFPRGPRPRWDRLLEYYDDATPPVRADAIAALAEYYRNPPIPPEQRENFNKAFKSWMTKEHGRLVDDLDAVLHLRAAGN